MRFYNKIHKQSENFEILAKGVNFQLFTEEAHQQHDPQDQESIIYMNDKLKQKYEAKNILENERKLIWEYFQATLGSNEIRVPNFAKIVNNVLLLNEVRVSDA